MTIERVIEILEHEKECALREIKNKCDRDCAKSDLLLSEMETIIAYNYALAVLNDMR